MFVGVAGASAALAGLLFVSLSINLARILADPWLPRRAGLTLLLMFETLLIAVVGLVPGQSRTALGAELLIVGIVWWFFATAAFAWRRPPMVQPIPNVVNAVAVQLATLPVIVAGVTQLVGSGGGLLWLFPAIVLLLGTGVLNAWVLLVEILR